MVVQREFAKLILRRYLTLVLACILLSGCAYVLDEPEMSVKGGNDNQPSMEVKIQSLTREALKTLNNDGYKKELIVTDQDRHKLEENGQGFKILPLPTTKPVTYRIGVGDLIELTTIIVEENSSQSASRPTLPGSQNSLRGFNNLRNFGNGDPSTTITKSASRVSADGSILFIETGRIDVQNKTTAEIRELVSNSLISNGLDPRFQLEVTEFKSQGVSLISYNSPVNNFNSDSQIGAALFPITEKPITLKEFLVNAGLILKKDVAVLVTVQRDKISYQFTLKHIFDEQTSNYYLIGGDTVTVEAFRYKQQHAYMLGGRSTPVAIPVSEEDPVPLSTALFQPGGLLSSQASKKSEVYLLRGQNPVLAYQLNVTDPARLQLTTELNLRPNDIIFASTVPIVDFNTVLNLINPLRILSGQTQPLFSPAF